MRLLGSVAGANCNNNNLVLPIVRKVDDEDCVWSRDRWVIVVVVARIYRDVHLSNSKSQLTIFPLGATFLSHNSALPHGRAIRILHNSGVNIKVY